MAESNLVFRVTSDVASATAGFKRLAASLKPVKKDADEASKSLAKVGQTKVAPKANTAAIAKVKSEIARLQDELRKALEVDVHADTREVQRKLRGLQTTLRTLQKPTVEPQVKTGFLDKVKTALGGVKSSLSRFGSGVADVFRNIGVPLIGAIGVAVTGLGVALGGTAVKALTLADEMERAKLQMDSFTHSGAVTGKLLGQIQKYADQTPFEFPELTSAAKRLLGVGTAAGQIPKQLAKIGDIAAQAGASVDDLALIYSQMVSSGRVSAEDMNQLADRGIAAWPKLAQALHMSVAEVRDLSSKGKLGAKDVQLLWDTLGKGAKGSTKALADTLSGQISTLKDTVNGVLRDLGNQLLPFAKVLVPQITKATEGLGGKIASALPGWISSLASGAEALIDAGGALLGGMKNVTVGFLGGIASFQAGLGNVLTSLGNFLSGVQGLITVLSPLTGIFIDVGDVADSLKSAGEGMQAASKTTADAAVQAGKNWDKWIASYNAGAAKAKSAIEGAKLKAALVISTGNAQTKIDELTTKWKAAKSALEKNPASAKLKANYADLDAKRKTAKSWLDQLNRYQANPKLLAKDLASGKIKYVKGKLVEVDKKKAEPRIDVQSNASSVAKHSQDAIDGVHGKTVYIHVLTRGDTTSPSNIPGTNFGGTSVSGQSAQVSVSVQDQRLADLIDVRVNGQAARAARVIRRRRAVIL